MTKKLIYLGAFLGFVFISFQLYIQFNRWDKLRPVVYVDNFTGSDIEISQSGETWLTIKDQETLVRKDLKPGKRLLYAKKLHDGAVDTIRINVAKGGKYVINPFGEMAYAIGQIMYAKNPGSVTEDEADGLIKRITAERVVKFEAEFIFELPPVQVREYVQGGGTLPHQNYTLRKTFIRRLDGDNFPQFTKTVPSGQAEQTSIQQTLSGGRIEVEPAKIETAAPQMTTPEAQLDHVKEILANLTAGDTPQAIANLAQLDEKASTHLSGRYKDLRKRQLMGVLSFEDWLIEQNKIDLSIYDALPLDGLIQQELPSAEVQALLDANEVNAALDALIEAGYTDAVLIAGSLAKVERAQQKGVITQAVYSAIVARKKMAIKNMLN
ncbi:MAG: hypothetical protein AAFR36_03755 [Bacteroidota bacterium]